MSKVKRFKLGDLHFKDTVLMMLPMSMRHCKSQGILTILVDPKGSFLVIPGMLCNGSQVSAGIAGTSRVLAGIVGIPGDLPVKFLRSI